jgi:hypothetical protein
MSRSKKDTQRRKLRISRKCCLEPSISSDQENLHDKDD